MKVNPLKSAKVKLDKVQVVKTDGSRVVVCLEVEKARAAFLQGFQPAAAEEEEDFFTSV